MQDPLGLPPGYRLLAPIAQGGMAEVFLAERVGAASVSKPVAIKRLLAHLGDDPDFVEMFLNEARIAVELSHGNIVPIFEFGEQDGAYFLVMEYVRGWDMARVLGACASVATPMPVPLALHVAAEVAKALSYAHERRDARGVSLGIIHRDISPANVLVSVEGEVKLTDFGIARAAAHAVTVTSGTTWLKGKIPYMSPEQARAERLDERSDLYSLGVLLFEMLTARRLFPGDDEEAVLATVRSPRVPPPSQARPEIPGDVDALVAMALAPDRTRRFATAQQLRQALTRLLSAYAPMVSAEDLRGFLGWLRLPSPLDPASFARDGLAGRSDPPPDSWAGAPRRAPYSVPPPPKPAVVAEGPTPAPSAAGVRVVSRAKLATIVGAALLAAAGAGAGARLVAGTRGGDPLAKAPVPSRVRLEVRSATPFATVAIDGADRGMAPLILEDLPRAPHEIRVHKTGHDPAVFNVDLAATSDLVIEASLPPSTGAE